MDRQGNYTVPLQKIFHFGMHVVFVGRDRRKFVYSHGLPHFRLTSMIQGVRVGVSTDQRWNYAWASKQETYPERRR